MEKKSPKPKIELFFTSITSSGKNILEKGALLWGKIRKISFDKVLYIWLAALVCGFLLYKTINKDLPGMGGSLVFATWWDDALEEQTLTKLTAGFMSQNPGITVKLEKMNWEEIKELLENEQRTSLNTAGNSRNEHSKGTPDVFSIDPYAINELERKSFLSALENSDPTAGNALQIISYINPLFYNIDLLHAAGFDRPPKNQTELLSYVQRLKETGTKGIGLALKDPRYINQQLLSWIWAATGNPELIQSFSFTSKEIIAALNFLNQLGHNLYTNPFTLEKEGLLEDFTAGRLGIMVGSTTDIKKLKLSGINFGITTIPGPESYTRKPVFSLTSWYLGINQRSNNQESAQKFALYLKEHAGDIAASAYAVPGSGSRNRERSRNDPHYAKAFDMYEASEMVRETYISPNVNSFSKVIQREVELLFLGSKTPEICAEAIQLGWREIAGKVPHVR